jgi:hypothetical protein
MIGYAAVPRQPKYVAYYELSEDKEDHIMPNCNTVAYPTNMNKNTDDHQMTGGFSAET